MMTEADIRRAVRAVLDAWEHDPETTVLLLGPVGSGKSLVARSLAEALPDLDLEEWQEVMDTYVEAGILDPDQPDERHLVVQHRPPFRAPHYTVSAAGMIGVARKRMDGEWRVYPGEVTLADHGVLVLDEAPEFLRAVLEDVWQAHEAGSVQLSAGGQVVVLPARFRLLLSANDCPCGGGSKCKCAKSSIDRYLGRLTAEREHGLVVVRMGE